MSGGGDSSNEYGIAVNDINNSGKRLSKTEGYISQTEWSKGYFYGKIFGQIVLILTIVVLPIIFVRGGFELGAYAIAILFISFITIVAVRQIVKRDRLKKVREKQLNEHRREHP